MPDIVCVILKIKMFPLKKEIQVLLLAKVTESCVEKNQQTFVIRLWTKSNTTEHSLCRALVLTTTYDLCLEGPRANSE
jgi:hypothetical protein